MKIWKLRRSHCARARARASNELLYIQIVSVFAGWRVDQKLETSSVNLSTQNFIMRGGWLVVEMQCPGRPKIIKLWILCIFFNFFFTKGFLLVLMKHGTTRNLQCIISAFAKFKKNEIVININLLKTNRGQNLTARFASPFHHNAAQAAQPPLSPPESTPSSMSAEPAAAFHRDESGKENQKRHFSF